MLETRVRFKAKDGLKEYGRTIAITGKKMEDINDQARKVIQYLKQQTGDEWYYEFVEEKELKE